MKYNRKKDTYTAIWIMTGALGVSLVIIGIYVVTGAVQLKDLL